MQTLIQGGKYQVLEVLEQQEGYKACLCIDVETNNQYKPLVLNIYEKSEDIRRFLPAFYRMSREQNSEFSGVMSGQHSITAVFAYHPGDKLGSFFRQVSKDDFELRSKYAFLLLEACLLLDAGEDFIAYSCLEPENIVIAEKLQKVMVNYIIRPRETIEKPYKWGKLANLLEHIFIRNRYVPDGVWDYIEDLKQNRDESIVSAFSRWKEISPGLMEEHKRLKKETLISYIIRLVKSFFIQRLKKFIRKKK